MTQIMALMAEAEDRLAARLDPGVETQAVQKQIVDRLDEAIKRAMQQRRRTSGAPAQDEGEKRTMPEDKKPGQNPAEEKQAGAATSDEATGTGPTDAKAAERLRGPLRESRRGWGNLPRRDRDELLQGVEEEFIERYRSQIDQYYRALGDQEE